LFAIEGKLNGTGFRFTYFPIAPKISAYFKNYFFINNPIFLEKNSSVMGYFFIVFLSNIRFFLAYFNYFSSQPEMVGI
jgi:hypothetical protein